MQWKKIRNILRKVIIIPKNKKNKKSSKEKKKNVKSIQDEEKILSYINEKNPIPEDFKPILEKITSLKELYDEKMKKFIKSEYTLLTEEEIGFIADLDMDFLAKMEFLNEFVTLNQKEREKLKSRLKEVPEDDE